jgi:FtsH-binding integral membrane protein
MGRILVQYVPAFKALESVVTKHIKHKYYKEIAQGFSLYCNAYNIVISTSRQV